MNELKAREILKVDKNATLEETKKSYRELVKKYHEDNNKALEDQEKIKEINVAYEFLVALKKKKQDSNDLNNKTVHEQEQKENNSNPKRAKRSSEKAEKDRAFDELLEFIKVEKELLKALNITTFPKYNQELLNPNNRGLIEVAVLQELKEDISKKISKTINNALAFDEFMEKIAEAKKQLKQWNVTADFKFLFSNSNEEDDELKAKYRGMIKAEELNQQILELDKKMKSIKENIDEYDIFVTFINELGEKLYYDESIKDKEEFLKANIRARGVMPSSEIRTLRKKIETNIKEREKQITDFKKFYQEKERELKQLYNANLGSWEEYIAEDKIYSYNKDILNSVKKDILDYESKLKKRLEAYYEFMLYFNNLSAEDKKLFEDNYGDYINDANRVKFDKVVYEDIKKQFEKLRKEEKENKAKEDLIKAYDEFRTFYHAKEKKLKEEYNLDLSAWKDFITNSGKYTIEDIKNAEEEIIKYEKDIKEKEKAHSDFVTFYENLSLEDQELFKSLNIDSYLSEESRILYNREIYDEVKKYFIIAKKEQEEQERKEQELNQARKDFVAFFKRKNEETKKIYGQDLSKWEKYTSANKYSLEELTKAKEEIIDFERELEKAREEYITSQFINAGVTTFDKVVVEDLKDKAVKYQKEQEEKQAFKEAFAKFMTFFSTKEKEAKELYGRDLSAWKKYIIGNREYSVADLDKATQEINDYLDDLKAKNIAHNDFFRYYSSLSQNDRKLYQSIVDIEKYTSEESRLLYNSDTYDELKAFFTKYKKKKEEKEKVERKRRIKKEFIEFFNKQEETFKKLYGVDLYKWRKYSLEENDYSEEEYAKIKKEIKDYYEIKENERLDKLLNLHSILSRCGVITSDFFKAKNKDINDVSIEDINLYTEYFFNISLIIGKINDLTDGEKKLKEYLDKNDLKIWEVDASKLTEFYKKLCIEEEKNKEKRNKEDRENSYILFRDYYLEIKRKFHSLYGSEITKWDDYINNKEKYSNSDFKKAYQELKEEEERQEDKRMSLLYQLQVALKKVGLDINDYLSIRNKDILSVSIRNLEDYINTALLLLKISKNDQYRVYLTSYLENNKIKLDELDYRVLIELYKDMKQEQDYTDDNSFKK